LAHYGAIGAAAGGLANLGVGAMGIENGFVQAGASMAAAGLVGGGITALAGGNFGQGFLNGVVGAAAGYFASIGMASIPRSSSERRSPQDTEQKAVEDLDVAKSETTPATPNGTPIQLVAGANLPGMGNPSYGFQKPGQAELLENMGKVVGNMEKKLGESSGREGWAFICDKGAWKCPSKGPYFLSPGTPTGCYCTKGRWTYELRI